MEAHILEGDSGEVALLELRQEAEGVLAMTVGTPRIANVIKILAQLALGVHRNGHACVINAVCLAYCTEYLNSWAETTGILEFRGSFSDLKDPSSAFPKVD